MLDKLAAIEAKYSQIEARLAASFSSICLVYTSPSPRHAA